MKRLVACGRIRKTRGHVSWEGLKYDTEGEAVTLVLHVAIDGHLRGVVTHG